MHGQHGAAAPAPAVSTVAGADFPGLGRDKADSAAKTVTVHGAWTFPWVASSCDYSQVPRIIGDGAAPANRGALHCAPVLSTTHPPCQPCPAMTTASRSSSSAAAISGAVPRQSRSGAGTLPCRCARAAPVRAPATACRPTMWRSEEHTSELQSPCNLVCRLLLEKKK